MIPVPWLWTFVLILYKNVTRMVSIHPLLQYEKTRWQGKSLFTPIKLWRVCQSVVPILFLFLNLLYKYNFTEILCILLIIIFGYRNSTHMEILRVKLWRVPLLTCILFSIYVFLRLKSRQVFALLTLKI